MLTQQPVAASLLERFRSVRQATMDFASRLTPEDMMVQSCAEASPVKWHLAHTSWFFETFVLSDFVAQYKPFNPDFRWLFNSYYKALGEMPAKKLRASFSRPPLDEILAYRQHVDAGIAQLLEQTPEDEAMRRIVLGLEHEYQHLELAVTDVKNAFFTNPLHPAYRLESPTEHEERISPPLEWLSYTPEVAGLAPGIVEIGVTPDPAALTSFAFDNETPRHKVYLEPFRLASRLVTCAEYLAFMEDSGYERPELWLSEGWDTMRDQGWTAPMYWRRDAEAKSGWSVFTLSGFRDLAELSETPVCHLSYFEADAFARWSGHRLPTEFEWEYVAARCHPAGNLLESGYLHPATASADLGQPQQLFGDVWEWTASPYTGYPGYKPLPGALGEYNGKFMSSQMILRGGSCATPQTHIRATYRNFFQPSIRWQFSGLRLAQDGPG
ncbi:ergothioneine biosynthesis protein EgtB [Bryocella elongata]|uniref:Ergothioneine biosynthesis protein EgtB n=1 Tax=Bryocella elongata TaxID=863522 RepID=A0A1H6AKL1_9BACT|nr:ergothioneine biosynthesis protein EgtB [Bryocella elongata]SEG48704.1 ergothioneine biosynthesis protein EgtB [Bryocella elongata]